LISDRPVDVSRSRRARGLRFRIVVTFALGGLALSVILAIVTYGLADRYLLRQREQSATRQAYLDARLLRDRLRAPETDVTSALDSLELAAGTSVVVHQAADWFGTSVAVGRNSLPLALRRAVLRGKPVHQRIDISGDPFLVVGLPISEADAGYFEVFSLAELDRTLAVIRNSLLAAAAATTIGAGLIGVWAGRRVLRPLREVSNAAGAIAGGDLSRRLPVGGDPDLAPLADSFNRMVDALQYRIERDTRFASDVSHELRSPLTTLVASADVLQTRRDELPERIRQPLDLVIEEIHRFERLVSELLELARVDAPVDPLTAEPVRLGELVLRAAADSEDPSFVVEIDPSLAEEPVLTDKRRLDRVLANLIENARTHGSGLRRIGVQRRDGVIRMEVDDCGSGVPDAERERIFERFFRGAAAGQRGRGDGTGLGLALVAEHVRVLEGRVWVEDVPGGSGARFIVEFGRVEP
jgi:signal transduction histidine kinase